MPLSPRTLRPASSGFNPRQISGLALWLDGADTSSLYTTDAGPVTAVSSPTEISGCVLWLDGADNATITASGGLVSQWTDKSASGAVLQASGSARPTLSSTGFNGRQALVFNGTSTNMASASAYTATNGLSGMTRIAVCQNVSGNSVVARVFSGGSDMFINMNGSWRAAVDSTSSTNFVSSTTFSSGSVLPAGVYADVFSSSAITQYGLGSLATLTVSGTIPSTTGTGTPTLHVGSNIGANFFWNGPIAEVIYFNRALTRAELARVESYLAAKWGISGVHAQATATSDPVGYWGDKSGNARHATQSTAGSRPTVSATALNGKRQLSLLSQHLRGPSTTWAGSASIYWVGRTGQSTNAAIVFGDGTTDQTDGLHAGWLNTAGVGAYGNGWQSGNAPRAESPSAWRNADIVAGVTLSPTEAIARVNGATTNTTAALTGSLSQSAAAQFYIGRESSGTWNNLSGSLAEVLIYQPALNASQRLRLERYLAAKYGITLAPQVSNADAQDWINRVYANGGTVSASTAAAVNQFCVDIEAASIRDRFFRLNLFCGGTSGTAAGINSALVPLYRGPSLGGTQYGGTVDTNVGPFVSGDYAESNGLDGDGIGKHLNTGMSPDNMGVPQTVHMAAFKGSGTWNTTREFMGTRDSDDFYTMQCRYPASTIPSMSVLLGGAVAAINDFPISTSASFLIGTRVSSSELYLWQNGTKIATGATSATTPGANSHPYMVFTRNVSGTAGASPWEHAMRAYSIGLGLNDDQAVAYNTAMQAFQTALNRNA
jgi:hypothetical protein